MRGLFFLALLLMVTAELCWSQEIKNDTLATKKAEPADTSFISGDREIIEIESNAKRFDPRKALMFSAVLPGAGQFYNKKYWKMPLVYGGFIGLIYVVDFYHTENIKYRKELFDLINDSSSGGVSPSGLTEDQLRSIVDQSRRERDFFIIMTGLFYILQMVDAHVDAHLKEFDVNPKMQVRLEPMMDNSMMTGRSTGVSLKIKF
jgi:Family of unknown function (DUF5683)